MSGWNSEKSQYSLGTWEKIELYSITLTVLNVYTSYHELINLLKTSQI